MSQKTSLFDLHQESGAKMVDFHGWEMPLQYSKIKEEHHAVRQKAGLFDVSHMGEVIITGTDAEAFLNSVVTNDISKMKPGAAQYNAMCYEDGGTVDDLIIYKKGDNHYMAVLNAANVESDYDLLASHTFGDVHLDNISADTALLALQGPEAVGILQTLTTENLEAITFFKFKEDVDIQGIHALASRTGYTGEDGFELYCAADDAPHLWSLLLSAGETAGLVPCGLGARDTLRFEAKLPLYGQELSANITPLEAGIGFAVKVDQTADFIGKTALKQQKTAGIPRKLVGLEMIDKGIPRTDYEVYDGDDYIGHITTGTQSPTLGKNVGLALLRRDLAEIGHRVTVKVRKKNLQAEIVKTPFYKR